MGRRAGWLTFSSLERLAILGDERLERHRGTAAELLDEVVRALEDAVLVVDHDLFEMLDEEGIAGTRFRSNSPYKVMADSPNPASDLRTSRLNSSKSTCLYWTSLPRTRPRTCAVSS